MDRGVVQLFIKDIVRALGFLGYKDAIFYRFLAENRKNKVFLYTLAA
jgi:hypothetical protein